MLETFPAEGSELGRDGRQLLCPSRSSEIQDHDRRCLATLSLTGDTCGAPRSPTWEINKNQRLRSFLGQGIVVQALLGVVVPASSGCEVGESAPWRFRPCSAWIWFALGQSPYPYPERVSPKSLAV